ncbi:phage tail tube protein [Orrella marina]|uniref:Uncharacterized protein n=1 Tax=Orrella marina TaxID=2163011 RepID=A0A2R4XF13_9BURK|nr:phage tail tube protein [Orrella marina]AWB32378.1 hypothetical protein DBV39_00140 [Orrella marina]
MAKKFRKGLLLAKIQPTAGTGASPAAGTDAILMRNVTVTPLVVEYAERDLIRPYLGNPGQIPVSKHQQIEFEVELAGAGTAGDAPAWGVLMRGCAFAETITAGTDVVYNPITDSHEMVTLHYFMDGILHKMIDARGTVNFDVTSKGIPFMRYRFIGTMEPITDAAMPSGVDYDKFIKVIGVNKSNTPTWSIGAYTGCLQSLTVDMANQLVWRTLIGCEGAVISDRSPTGNMVIELPTIAQLNWPTLVSNATDQAIVLTHGQTAGNIIEISIAAAQITNPTYSEQDGIAMLNLGLNLQPKDGNDEIEITVK